MKKVLSFNVLTAFLLTFLIAGTGFAQFPGFGLTTTLSGQVTAGDDSAAVVGHTFLLSMMDSTGFETYGHNLITTDENGMLVNMSGEFMGEGSSVVTVIKNHTYTITSLDTFATQPFTAQIIVGEDPVEFNIHLENRTDLNPVNGTVTFNGAGVETSVYFVKLPDDVDITDFREYENSHFKIPGMMLTRWASYEAMTAADGSFNLEMLDGNYVVYIPQAGDYLTHWGIFTVDGANTETLAIRLTEMEILSGTIANTAGYEFVQVMGYSVNAGRPFTAIPDSNGYYEMQVAEGEYVVRVTAFFHDDVLDDDFMYHVFYDTVYNAEDAVHVTVGQDGASGIDFTLPEATVSKFSVSGTITSNQSGLPLEGAQVYFVSYNAFSNLFRTWEGSTDADGNYTVSGYTMLPEDSLVGFAWKDSTFFAQFYNGQATFLTADPIVYHAGEDVTGIDFALDTLDTQNSFAISGTVVDEDGNPVITGNVTAFSTDVSVGVITAMIDTLGHYNFGPVFHNGSTVYLQAWGGYGYVPEIYNNAHKWTDDEVTAIIINGADQTIDFELEKTAPARAPLATIRGSVDLSALGKTSAASAYEGAVVYVRPVPAEGEEPGQWVASDYVDANGQFAVPVEEEGEYDILLSTRENGDIETTASTDADNTLKPTAISGGGTTAVLKSIKLHNAYPNPFNPMTTIQVEMAKTQTASLIIYNVIGQKVKTLFNGKMQQGLRTFNWNGTAQNGKSVASGLYFYQLKTNATVQTKAVMFLK